MYQGFVKVALGIPEVRLGDCRRNTLAIESLIAKAEGQGVEVVCFPEMSLTGYTVGDLVQQQLLLDNAEQSLLRLMEVTRNLNVAVIVGLPFSHEGVIYNCAAVLQGGHICGIVPKSFLSGHKEFYEKRWFVSGRDLPRDTMVRLCGQNVPMGVNLLFELGHFTFGIEICEDLWAPIPPSTALSVQGAEIVFNLSATDELAGKHDYRRQLVMSQSARSICAYVFVGAGYGESTQDVVFGGEGLICENGHMIAQADRFSLKEQLLVTDVDVNTLRCERRVNTSFSFARRQSLAEKGRYRRIELEVSYDNDNFQLLRTINPLPFLPDAPNYDERLQEVFNIQSTALVRRIAHTEAKTVVLGVSGGLDSTLALLVCVRAFDALHRDRKGIVGITMPGFGTTDRTYTNALALMKSLGITMREISIKEACLQHFKDIGHNPEQRDVTYENAQARERTQVLMDVANQMNGFVVGTGDLSELALGWCTFGGDQISMYGVNAGVPKTLIRYLVRWYAQHEADPDTATTLLDVLDTPVSPELIPAETDGTIAQKTEDLVGPYELHDFFLYQMVRYGYRPKKIYYLAQHAFDGHDERVARYSGEQIRHWLTVFCRRFFAQQYKRSSMPDGPKVGKVNLSPRGDWRMPSDASSAAWLDECEELGA